MTGTNIINRRLSAGPNFGCWIVIIWFIGVLINLAIVAGVIYAACHFISKYW